MGEADKSRALHSVKSLFPGSKACAFGAEQETSGICLSWPVKYTAHFLEPALLGSKSLQLRGQKQEHAHHQRSGKDLLKSDGGIEAKAVFPLEMERQDSRLCFA